MSIKIEESITCDACNAELIDISGYPAIYRLALSSINTNRNNTGIRYAVGVFPPFDGTKHFCDVKCLAKWTESINSSS